MPSNRAQLEELIRNQSVLTPYSDIIAFATAILDAGWLPPGGLIIEDHDVLDNLPRGAVVRVNDMVYHKKTTTFFCWSGESPRREPSETIMQLGTVVLIYRGENE